MSSSHKNPSERTPTWLLERVAQGELAASQVDELRARLAAEGRSLEAELATLAKSNQEFLSQVDKVRAVAEIRRLAARDAGRSSRRRFFSFWIASLALAGSLGIGILLLRPGRGPALIPSTSEGESPIPSTSEGESPGGESTRIKGTLSAEPRLLVYRQRAAAANDTQPERLKDGAHAARGDLLQLAYAAARDGAYGVLLSIDGAGRVTQHLPEPGARSAAPLRSLAEIRLPSAYELDDAPGFERFLLVSSTEPFPVTAALDAARALASLGARAQSASLALAPTFHQTSVLLQKTGKGTP